MTQEEFDSTRFTAAMSVEYLGAMYWISTVNFYERLLGILPVDSGYDDEEPIWVRCENVELIK